MGCTSSTPAEKDGDLNSTERLMNGRRGIDKSERIHSSSDRQKLAQRLKTANAQSPKADTPAPPKLNADGQLIAEEVVKRISGSVETKEVVVGDIKSGEDAGLIHVRYAALTQRGYYPDNPHKENQDAYNIIPSKFASGEGDAFFAVFDGHGDAGDKCAIFAKNKLPAYLAQNIKKRRAALNAEKLKNRQSTDPLPKNAFHPSSWPHLSEAEYEEASRKAHLQCNKAMNDDKQVKDSMSGTTAISVGFHAGRMTVSNVGDSRCVLGYRIETESSTPSEEEKKEVEATVQDDVDDASNAEIRKFTAGDLIAIPLSEDQTPYRKDERERLKKAGARICSIDQMEGLIPMHENWGELDLGNDIDEEGDPPRVWCQDHNYPGTAFSRSLGDTVGKDIGVSAEPEILSKKVTKGDEILVIASDGIFEFLTNQQVIDICSECDDPLNACTKLLEASYERWLHYELRTDDITCIVLFLKNSRPDDRDIVGKMLGSTTQKVKKMEGVRRISRDLSMPKIDASEYVQP